MEMPVLGPHPADARPESVPPTDAELVARCRAGEGASWALLVQRYQRLVYAIVRRLGEDEHQAADVFQAVFTRLLEHLPRLQQPERLRAWIVTTARREAQRLRGRQQRLVPWTDDPDDGPEPAAPWGQDPEASSPEAQWIELQELHRVREALEQLSPPCRRLLALLFTQDEAASYQVVAQQLGLPVGSIGPQRGRCLARLRALLVGDA